MSTPQGLRHFLWILHWQWALLQSHKAIFFSHWDPFQLLWCFIHSTIYPRMPSTLPARLGYDLRDQVLNCIHQRRCNIHSFIISKEVLIYILWPTFREGFLDPLPKRKNRISPFSKLPSGFCGLGRTRPVLCSPIWNESRGIDQAKYVWSNSRNGATPLFRHNLATGP